MIQTMSDELKFKIAQSVLNSNARIVGWCLLVSALGMQLPC